MLRQMLRPDRLPDRRLPWLLADVALALALAFFVVNQFRGEEYLGKYGSVTTAGWFLLLTPCVLIVFRRFAPATILFLTVGFVLVAAIDHADANNVLVLPFAAYLVATTRPRNASAAILVIAGVPASTIALYGPDDSATIGVAVMAAMFVAAWLTGVRMRDNREQAERLAAEAAEAEVRSEQAAREAVEEERRRIARELHDAVGHAVNVIVMQAGAARLSTLDERAIDSLRSIERVGRTALDDLDRMLALMHDDAHPDAPLEPAHALSSVSALVAGMRDAGMDVALEEIGVDQLDTTRERPLGAAGYRIVQECLTNAAKHAGPAHVDVVVEVTPAELVITVSDDGRGAAATPSPNGGRGLVGMRERVSTLNGTLEAGPVTGRGYRVCARIPRRQEAAL